MTFLNSAFLLGLPLIAVPVIIHLLNRRRQDVIRWGAMQFLLEAIPRRKRIWRLSDLILMLLRALAVLLLVLALAQPLLKSSLLGHRGNRDIVLVIDDSLSTALARSGGTVFDGILDKTDEILDQAQSGDSVRVLLASSPPRWLVASPTNINNESKRLLRMQIRQLKSTQCAGDLLRSAQEAIDAEPADINSARVVTIVTDGQAYGWRIESATGWKALHDQAEAATQKTFLGVQLVETDKARPMNLAVEDLTCARSVLAAGQGAEFVATIRNGGAVASEEAVVSWTDNGQPLGVASVPKMPARANRTASIEHRFESPGLHRIACRIDRGDDLAPDNSGQFVVEVADSVPVLIVDGAPTSDPYKSQIDFLLAALGNSKSENRQWKSAFNTTVVEAADVGRESLAKYRCVVLSDVVSLPEASVRKLTEYVKRGGGLWIALGAGADRGFYMRTMQDAGLLPVPLDTPIGDQNDKEKFSLVNPPTTSHIATKLLSDTQRLDLDRAKIFRRHTFGAAMRPDVNVLLTTGDSSPLVVENTLGRGRVIVQGVPMDLEWTNLPACQAFVVMANEWLWYLIDPAMPRRNLRPGEALVQTMPKTEADKIARLQTPAGNEKTDIAAQVLDDQAVFRSVQTYLPGEYTLSFDATPPMPFFVRRDPQESKLKTLKEDDRTILTSLAGLNFGGEPLKMDSVADAGKQEPIWTALLVMLPLLMVAELLLARRITGRKFGEATPVSMTPDLVAA